MSWKIYTGFILKNITTLEKTLEYFQSIIPRFNAVADDYWKKMIISHALAELDNDCAEGKIPSREYLSSSEGIFKQFAIDSIKSGERSFADTSVKLSIAAATIKGKKRVIGILFCDNNTLTDEFFKLDEIEEYAYFDNSDKLEEVSTRDWNYRGKVWDKLFENYSTPNKAMLSYDIIGDRDYRNPNYSETDITVNMVSFEDRIKGAVNHRILKNKSFSNLDTYTQFMKSDEAAEARNLITPIVTERLKKSVSLADLSGATYD